MFRIYLTLRGNDTKGKNVMDRLNILKVYRYILIVSIALFLDLVSNSNEFTLAQNNNNVIEDQFNYSGQYSIDQTKLVSHETTSYSFVLKYAQEYKISPALIMALIKKESTFVSTAIGDNGLAVGLMQLHWDAAYDAGYRSARGNSTASAKADWPVDGLDPDRNIRYGSTYLKLCYEDYKDAPQYKNDPLKNSVSCYNLGLTSGPNTKNERNYVNIVLEYYKDYLSKSIVNGPPLPPQNLRVQ